MPTDLGSVLDRLPEARRTILRTLKRCGEARAEELAATLEVTASAMRQHLTALEAEGLVTHHQVKGSPGRPKHVYHLTASAEGLFPKAYGELTTELLDYVQEADPALVESIFAKRRQRRIEGARARLAGKPFAARVAELAHILDEDGYLAEVEPLGEDGAGGFRIVEHNCAILSVASKYGLACSSELEFIRAALPDATIDRVKHMMAGAYVCAYEVRPKAS
ncbi:MAG: ArsR family transcriptional regulator [Actinobacteria bacterium]|nr:ArsR family transcriptional regulator [Actinomycetota bacterium]